MENPDGEIEPKQRVIKFGRKLAAIDKATRDRGVKALQRWISKQEGLTLLDLLKIWKGLFFCMWMSDKPLIQAELADQLAQLIHLLKGDAPFIFIQAFYQTIDREWVQIDKFRKVLSNSFKFLQQKNWDESSIESFNKSMSDCCLSSSQGQNGLKFHVIDIYLEELHKIAGNELAPKVLNSLLDPFYSILRFATDRLLVKRVTKSVFNALHTVWIPDSDPPSEDDRFFDTDYNTIASKLFEFAASKETPNENRNNLYSIQKQYLELAKKKESTRKRKVESEPEPVSSESTSETVSEQPVSKSKRKKLKKKQKNAQSDSNTKQSNTPETKQSNSKEKTSDTPKKNVKISLQHNKVQEWSEAKKISSECPVKRNKDKAPSRSILKRSQ